MHEHEMRGPQYHIYRDFALCIYIHKQIKYQFTVLKGIVKILKTMFGSWKIWGKI